MKMSASERPGIRHITRFMLKQWQVRIPAPVIRARSSSVPQSFNTRNIFGSLSSAVLAGALAFTSCKTAQPYQQPVAINNNLYRNTSAPDTNSIAGIPWNDMFGDTLLQSIITEGIANNFDLKIAVARINRATANARQSRLAFFPNIDANATAGFQKVPATQFGFPEAYQLSVSSSWEADIWGKLSSSKRASLALLLQSEAYKRAVQTQLIADIANNYYLLTAYDAQLRITEKTVENRKKEVETMRALKESNIVTGAAVVQSVANQISVEITIPDLKRAIRETENNLSTLLGKSADTVLRNDLDQQIIRTGLSIGVPAQLLANRPDVQEAEYQLRSSFELVNVARAYFYPSIIITASGGLSGTSLTQLFNPAAFFANITGGLLQPVFERGINKQRLAVAQANQEEYLNAFRKKIQVAGQEVADALYSFQAAGEKRAMRDQQITFLQKSVDYTKELLKYSSATNYTDVLTSEQSLLAAQLSSVDDKLQQLVAIVNLYKSLGGGWK